MTIGDQRAPIRAAENAEIGAIDRERASFMHREPNGIGADREERGLPEADDPA